VLAAYGVMPHHFKCNNTKQSPCNLLYALCIYYSSYNNHSSSYHHELVMLTTFICVKKTPSYKCCEHFCIWTRWIWDWLQKYI